MTDHHCPEYDKWNEFEMGVYYLAYAHGVKYPDDGPLFKFCPFCGEKIEVKKLEISKCPITPIRKRI